MEKVIKKKYTLFTGKQLLYLILPIVIEQIFSTSLGLVDSMMVSGIDTAGNASVGVANVDLINNLIIQLFLAFSTGGVIVTSQLIGARKIEEANKSAKQVVMLVLTIGLTICLGSIVLNNVILKLVYPDVTGEVFRYESIYFYITALSFPFIALFYACAALLRAQRKSKITMISAAISLVVNITLNATFIYVFKWGVIGAAVATAISRVFPAAYTLTLLTNKNNLISINLFEKFRFDGPLIKKILIIAIPSGIESCLFQLGKIMTNSCVKIAYYQVAVGDSILNVQSNALTMSNQINNISSVVGSGVGTASLTVVGQAVGTGDYDQVKYYIKKMFIISYIANTCMVATTLLLSNWMVHLYTMPDEAYTLALNSLYFAISLQFITYPLSFTTPSILKSTSDVKYVMWSAIGSMLIVRVGLCYILARGLFFGIYLGVYGYWIAMCSDWISRSLLFGLRLLSGKWKHSSGLFKEEKLKTQKAK